MFVVLYRWHIKSDLEDQFKEAWAEITEYYIKNFDSLGSRLHRGSDGIFYAYAQWKSAQQRENAFLKSELNEARNKMLQAIEDTLPETILEIKSDYLK